MDKNDDTQNKRTDNAQNSAGKPAESSPSKTQINTKTEINIQENRNNLKKTVSNLLMGANRLLADVNTSGENENTKPFSEIFYEKVNSVIGGDNANQFLLLMLPGQALSAEDFAYDYKNQAPKGPTVEANESKLANKLFDPCKITGGDNGLTLPYQYRSALDMLSPKLNAKIAKAKNELRKLLLTDYPYDFGDGSEKTYTLQEVFFRLYDDWVKATKEWSDKQNKEKSRLREIYQIDTQDGNTKYNDAYLEWYETTAETYLNNINEKMSKVLSVFSPNDMKILEGILDSGSGAELQQARQTLANTEKLTPDGGYVYPVKFNPTNWFELLDTSFTPVDLLETPAALAMQMQNLSSRRLKVSTQINQISSLIPSNEEITNLAKEINDVKNNINGVRNTLVQQYGNGMTNVFDVALDLVSALGTEDNKINGVISKLVNNDETITNKDGSVKGLIEALTGSGASVCAEQQKLVADTQQLADLSAKEIAAQNLKQLELVLTPLKAQLEEINNDISDLQAKIQLSNVVQVDNSGNKYDVAPSSVPEGYTQFLMEEDFSTISQGESKNSSSSQSSCGAGFWFFSADHSESEMSSSFEQMSNESGTKIAIGMNIAKVGIEREWFNPDVFALSKDMFNVTTSKIAPNPTEQYTEFNDARFNAMSSCIFPCYPVAMLIARDISIKISSENSSIENFANSTEKHASTGGGFLFFNGSKASSSSSSSSSAHTSSSANDITIKFDTPQILGYYLEATCADKSTPIDNISDEENTAGYVTIEKFVADYRKIIEEMRAKKDQKNSVEITK